MDEFGERSHAADVAKLTPAERERYEHWEKFGEAARSGVPLQQLGDPRLVGAVLQGPAGEVVHGVVEAPKQAIIEDPVSWEQQMRAERVARDQVRAPYLAPARRTVRFTRVATRGRTQLQEVVDHLGASGLTARPDLLYGAYRVPDLISPGRLGGEGSSVVEWDIVHATEGTLPPAAPPAFLSLDAREVWVARAPNEPRPLDEDLALDILARAGVGPERTLALARDVAITKQGGDDSSGSTIEVEVRGVHLLVAPARPVPWARRRPGRRGGCRSARRTASASRSCSGRPSRRPCIPSAPSGRACRRCSRT